MLYPILAILGGLFLLVLGANRFVGGASVLALRLGLPPILIGIVVIGVGTSMPELIVSATAAYHNNPGIALGNAFGSNITNIALILGLCAVVSPIVVSQSVLNREFPILLGASALSVILVRDGEVSRLDAAIMLAAFVVAMVVIVRRTLAEQEDAKEITQEVDVALKGSSGTTGASILWIVAGLAVMLASSELLVWGAVKIAEHFGVNELVIGLTIVALGTALPELASSLIAARKGEHDLALGNVLGAVIFNLLAVVGTAGLIHPLRADHDLVHRDIAVLSLMAVMLCMFCLDRRPPSKISRSEGAILACSYLAYTLYLIFDAGIPGKAAEIW